MIYVLQENNSRDCLVEKVFVYDNINSEVGVDFMGLTLECQEMLQL